MYSISKTQTKPKQKKPPPIEKEILFARAKTQTQWKSPSVGKWRSREALPTMAEHYLALKERKLWKRFVTWSKPVPQGQTLLDSTMVSEEHKLMGTEGTEMVASSRGKGKQELLSNGHSHLVRVTEKMELLLHSTVNVSMVPYLKWLRWQVLCVFTSLKIKRRLMKRRIWQRDHRPYDWGAVATSLQATQDRVAPDLEAAENGGHPAASSRHVWPWHCNSTLQSSKFLLGNRVNESQIIHQTSPNIFSKFMVLCCPSPDYPGVHVVWRLWVGYAWTGNETQPALWI